LKKRVAHNRRQAAFSLVEVVMALGIAAFCLVALLGLMPVGLKTVRDARGDSLRAEILKSMGNIAQQTDYSLLSNLAGKKYYFDINGLVVNSTSADAIYEAVLSTGPVNVPSSSTSTALSGATSVTVAIRRSANTNSEATTHTLFISNNGN
jgi:uncharacterized protein (TIGR02598 family)